MGLLSAEMAKLPLKKALGGVAKLGMRSVTVSTTVSMDPSYFAAGTCSKVGSGVIVQLVDLHHVDNWSELRGARQDELGHLANVAGLGDVAMA